MVLHAVPSQLSGLPRGTHHNVSAGVIRLPPDASHVDLKTSRAARDEHHGLIRHWRNLKLLGILVVHVVAQQERTPTKLRTAHLDRAGKVLVEVTTLDHDIPPDRVESQPALRSKRSTKPKPHRPTEQQVVVGLFGQLPLRRGGDRLAPSALLPQDMAATPRR